MSAEKGSGLPPPGDEIEVPIDPRLLLIENVPLGCTDEMVQLYIYLIINSNLDETFKIEEMRRNKTRIMIRFNRNYAFEETVARQKKVPSLCGQTVAFGQVKVPDTIRVSSLSPSCTKEILNLYFTNAKISQGGEIRSIKTYPFENKALIQFKNYTKIDDIMSRSHVICENVIKIEKYHGPIENEYMQDEEGELIDPSEASGMPDGGKKGDSKSKQRRSLLAMSSQKSFTNAAASNIDRAKIIISNIQENANVQQLDFFIQLITSRFPIHEINWSWEQKGKLLIEFTKDIDTNKIMYEFNENALNNLNGKPIKIETVNVTRTLVVLVRDTKVSRSVLAKLDSNSEETYKPESIPASKDLLELYFINKQRSGGGEVESIVRKSSRFWLVVMKDVRAVKDILSRKHVIDEKPLKVFPYYDNFGLPYLFKPVFDDQFQLTSSSLKFKLKIKDDRMRYFCKVKSLHKKLNDILSESNAISRYNKQESNILYVDYMEKLPSKVPYMERIWRLRVKESIEYFLQIYKFEKLTLSFNQWATITKTKQISESILNAGQNNDDDFDDGTMMDFTLNGGSEGVSASKIKLIGDNCAIISAKETNSNIEISIVGPNMDVDKFIVKIKDIICKAYFTFELEEKIIKFKTYLYECEELLSKWLKESNETNDSDSEITRSKDDSFTIGYANSGNTKLNKNKRQTIDEFISKLERDHLDMELSYGKLFQELGYTFLSQASTDPIEDDDDQYKDFNDQMTTTFDEMAPKSENQNQSQMDKIKNTLDELRSRINDMRKKFRQYSIKAKRDSNTKDNRQQKNIAQPSNLNGHINEEETSANEDDNDEDDDEDEDEDENIIKVCIYVKDQAKIVTFKIHRKCKVGELKRILFEKIASQKANSTEDLLLTFNKSELTNDSNTIMDYGINDKATVTLEYYDDDE